MREGLLVVSACFRNGYKVQLHGEILSASYTSLLLLSIDSFQLHASLITSLLRNRDTDTSELTRAVIHHYHQLPIGCRCKMSSSHSTEMGFRNLKFNAIASLDTLNVSEQDFIDRYPSAYENHGDL